jgi:hypothetical protein
MPLLLEINNIIGKYKASGTESTTLERPNNEHITGISIFIYKQTNKLHGLSPRANYTDRATAASRRSDCQLLRIKGAKWSA